MLCPAVVTPAVRLAKVLGRSLDMLTVRVYEEFIGATIGGCHFLVTALAYCHIILASWRR